MAAARGARHARTRRAPAAVRDRGAHLVLPPLPHVAAEGRRSSRSATTSPAGCTAPTSASPRRRRATATTSRSRSSRSPASGAATSPRPRRSTSARSRSPRPTRPSQRRAPASARRPSAASARRAPAERPLRRGEERYARSCRALAGELGSGDRRRHAEGLRPARHGRRRIPDRRRSGRPSPAQEPEPKYMICNADESEPGTFKDRQILAEQPHLVLEGMMLGMLVTGSEEGWVFIRHEYGPEEEVLREEIERAARAGPARRRRLRHRPTAADRDLHLAGRLHPRRGVGAAGVHGGPPRRAAQQAAVPRALRTLGQADADELRRDLRRRPDHPRARRRLVEGPGHQRRDRA